MDRLTLQYLPLDQIDVSRSNVRKANLEQGIDELANSIRSIGVQQPVVVIKNGDRYDLIIGQRRYLASKRAGLNEIPALITTVKNDTDLVVKSFSENIHRQDLDYKDKMQVAHELVTKLRSADQAARLLGVSVQTVKNYLGYAAVPETIKKMVDAGELSAATAVRIARSVPDEEKAVRIAQKIRETPLNQQRRSIIDIARENPGADVDAIIGKAAKRATMKKITIHVTQRVYDAIRRAAETYRTDREDVVTEAVVDWLHSRGFSE